MSAAVLMQSRCLGGLALLQQRLEVGAARLMTSSSAARNEEAPSKAAKAADSGSGHADDAASTSQPSPPEEQGKKKMSGAAMRNIANKMGTHNPRFLVHGDRSHEIGMVAEMARRQDYYLELLLAKARLARTAEARPLTGTLLKAMMEQQAADARSTERSGAGSSR